MENHLLIDSFIFRQSYKLYELTEIFWVANEQNLTDEMTNKSASNSLKTPSNINNVNVDGKV